MGRYDDIKTLLASRGLASHLTPMAPAEATALREAHPLVPEEYLDFLVELGFGSLGESSFMMYQGLMRAEHIYDAANAAEIPNLLLFGDDFQGYCAAFEPAQGWRVVEVDPIDMSISPVASSFDTFLRQRLIPLIE